MKKTQKPEVIVELTDDQKAERFEEEKVGIYRYITENWLPGQIKKWSESIEQFKAAVEKDPEYAIRWQASSILTERYNYIQAEGIVVAIEKHPEMKIWQILEEAIESETSSQMNWSASNSTCKWTNAAEEAKAEARVRWIRDTKIYLRQTKKYDI